MIVNHAFYATNMYVWRKFQRIGALFWVELIQLERPLKSKLIIETISVNVYIVNI